jgi:hypothetical protein
MCPTPRSLPALWDQKVCLCVRVAIHTLMSLLVTHTGPDPMFFCHVMKCESKDAVCTLFVLRFWHRSFYCMLVLTDKPDHTLCRQLLHSCIPSTYSHILCIFPYLIAHAIHRSCNAKRRSTVDQAVCAVELCFDWLRAYSMHASMLHRALLTITPLCSTQSCTGCGPSHVSSPLHPSSTVPLYSRRMHVCLCVRVY